jgi:Sec-independent protein translocase protein TatA
MLHKSGYARHRLIELGIVLLVLGLKRLPETARVIGRGMRGSEDRVMGVRSDEPSRQSWRRGTSRRR